MIAERHDQMEKSKRAVDRFTERFEIPGDALPGTPLITLTGSRRIHIDKHKGILEYGQEFISVNCGNKLIGVFGASLELASMNARELLITGDIQRIEFT